MGRRFRVFGHAPHPPSTHFPLAFLLAAPLADAAAWWFGEAFWFRAAFVLLAAGCAAGLPAAVTGFMEYLSLKSGHPGERDVNRHMVLALSSLGLDVVSLVARRGTGPLSGPRFFWAAALSAAAAGLIGLAGWFGGRLVYTHRIGLDDETPRG